MGSSVRRKPNAFNLVHQLEMMIRGGMSREQVLGSLEVDNRLTMIVHGIKLHQTTTCHD